MLRSMSLLANTALWSVVLGVLTPLLTAVAQQPGWSRRTRTIVGVGTSVLVGVVTLLATGGISDGTSVVAGLVIVVTSAETAYRTFWRGSGITDTIEYATSPAAGGRRDDTGF